MVLKVVTGKILEALELSRVRWLAVPFLELDRAGSGTEPFALPIAGVSRRAPSSPSKVRLSKIEDYLIDNQHVPMLSKVKARGQAQSGGAADAVPNSESGTGLFAKGTGHPESDLSVRDKLGQPPNSIPEIGPLVPNYS